MKRNLTYKETLPFGIDVSFAGKILPFFDLGLGWLVPAALGCIAGIILRSVGNKKGTAS